MAELGNLTINVTCPDTNDIEAFGEAIGKLLEDKYKKLLEDQTIAELTTKRQQEYPTTYLITSGGDVVNTWGHSPHDASGPFKVNGKSVYISNQFIN